MRELVFELDYQTNWNPVADALVEHPEAAVRSLSCHVTPKTLWRVDLVSGSPEALSVIETAYSTSKYFPDCLVTGDCEAEAETRVLDRTDDSLVIYCVWERSTICTSVPHLALEQLGDGLLFETRQEGKRQLWRIVLSGGEPVSSFADALEKEVEGVGGISLLRLAEHSPIGSERAHDGDRLPAAQRRALHAAVERGYYETPRKTELGELAAELDVPRSTLSYRLRRAEAALATEFVESDSSLDSLFASH
ncbi:MAG: helix-turn-helix domain-containing protein [Euryarchaeota archaeon]|nr:helix-turn-helix domain-containing protein [Euryarchaeota archaeon]